MKSNILHDICQLAVDKESRHFSVHRETLEALRNTHLAIVSKINKLSAGSNMLADWTQKEVIQELEELRKLL